MSDLTPVRGAPLQQLIAYMGPYKGPAMSLKSLAGFPLEELHVGGSNLSDLTPLKEHKLKVFLCEDCPITDLSPLAGMPLTRLWIHNTQVASLSPLRGMPLRELTIHGCPRLTDLSPLKDIPTLKTIDGKPAAEILR